MIGVLLALLVTVSLTLVPLLWRKWSDRQAARGLMLHADVDAAVRRALGGESFVSVTVEPSAPWHRGRVILSAPLGYRSLLDRSWKSAAATVPREYDLVLRGASPDTATLEVAA